MSDHLQELLSKSRDNRVEELLQDSYFTELIKGIESPQENIKCIAGRSLANLLRACPDAQTKALGNEFFRSEVVRMPPNLDSEWARIWMRLLFLLTIPYEGSVIVHSQLFQSLVGDNVFRQHNDVLVDLLRVLFNVKSHKLLSLDEDNLLIIFIECCLRDYPADLDVQGSCHKGYVICEELPKEGNYNIL